MGISPLYSLPNLVLDQERHIFVVDDIVKSQGRVFADLERAGEMKYSVLLMVTQKEWVANERRFRKSLPNNTHFNNFVFVSVFDSKKNTDHREVERLKCFSLFASAEVS